jgi:hypothetical protein
MDVPGWATKANTLEMPTPFKGRSVGEDWIKVRADQIRQTMLPQDVPLLIATLEYKMMRLLALHPVEESKIEREGV